MVVGSGGNLIKCPSRAYIARPGASSCLSLRDSRRRAADDAFAGMVAPEARYDPASNLVYAIRNGGAEMTVWTAAPLSELVGPDEEVRDAANQRRRRKGRLGAIGPAATGRGESESAKKKNRSKKKKKKNRSKKGPSAKLTAHLPQEVLGAQFVQPRARVRGNKKRRNCL